METEDGISFGLSIPFGVVVLIFAFAFFCWGHWVGVNDARAEFEAKRSHALNQCSNSSAYMYARDLSAACFSGSNRRSKDIP